MAFESKSMSCAVYTNGWTFWHYRTDDELETVLAPPYFVPFAEHLRAGDFIAINAKTAGLGDSHALAVVRTNSGAGGITLSATILAG